MSTHIPQLTSLSCQTAKHLPSLSYIVTIRFNYSQHCIGKPPHRRETGKSRNIFAGENMEQMSDGFMFMNRWGWREMGGLRFLGGGEFSPLTGQDKIRGQRYLELHKQVPQKCVQCRNLLVQKCYCSCKQSQRQCPMYISPVSLVKLHPRLNCNYFAPPVNKYKTSYLASYYYFASL